MKKGWIISLSIVGTLAAGIGVFAGIVGYQTHQGRMGDSYLGDAYADWMSCVEENTLVKDLAIPGSHDAGTAGMAYVAETQRYSILEQLNRGVRYLDLRVKKKGNDLVMFHGPLSGMSYSNVLSDLASFMEEHPQEFLILDYQHFGEGALEPAFKRLEEAVGTSRLLQNDTTLENIDFMDTLTVGQARGKCIVVAGTEKENLSRPYAMVRDQDTQGRAGSVLHSYYDSDAHKADSKTFANEALPRYIERRKTEPKGLFVLQCQLTDGTLVFGPAYREASHKENLKAYLTTLLESQDLSWVNIVMEDFITIDKSCLVLQVNQKKGVIEESKATQYEQMLKA